MGFRALGAEDLLQLNVLRAYRVDGSAVGRRLNLDGRRRSRGERHLGRRREIQVFGQIELFLEAGILFGALRRVGRVVHAQSRGSRERAQVGRRLLQAIEQQPGAALLQQAGGQRVQHLHPGHLHRVHVLQQRQDEAMRLAAGPLARHAHAAAQRLQMEMTIIAPAQRGSLAEDAVNFYVMAVIDRHIPSLSWLAGRCSPFALRVSLFAFRSSRFALRVSLFAFRSSLFALRFSLFAFRQNRWYPDRGLQSPSCCHPDRGLQSPSCLLSSRPRTSVPFSLSSRPRTSVPFSLSSRPRTLVPFLLSSRPRTSVPFLLSSRPRTSVPFLLSSRPRTLVPFLLSSRPRILVPFLLSSRPRTLVPFLLSSRPRTSVPFVLPQLEMEKAFVR